MIAVPSHTFRLYLVWLLFCITCLFIPAAHAAKSTASLLLELKKAEEAINNDDLDTAEKLLRQILKADKSLADAHRLLGILSLNKGLQDEAIRELELALQSNSQDELSREVLFSIYYNRGRELFDHPREGASPRGDLERATALRPEGVMTHYYLGAINYQEQRDAECIFHLLEVAETVPKLFKNNLHSMLYNCALNLLTQKNAKAAADVVPYLSGPPDATTGELLLAATISLEADDLDRAVTLYGRVLEQDPQQAVALNNLAIARERLAERRLKEEQSRLQSPGAAEPTDKSHTPPAETDQNSKETIK